MKPETIQETTRLWREQPDKAKSQPTVKARSDGSRAIIEAGPFTWHADLPRPLGGASQAPSPTALLLGALAGCAVVFIRDTLAPQLGVQVDAVEATVRCDTDARGLLGLDDVAPDPGNITLDIRVESPAGRDDVEKIFQVWRERCPIYLALVKAMEVTMNAEAA